MHIKQTILRYVNNSHQKYSFTKFITDRIVQNESTYNRLCTDMHWVLANKTKHRFIVKGQGWSHARGTRLTLPKLLLFLADFTGAGFGLPLAHLQTHE